MAVPSSTKAWWELENVNDSHNSNTLTNSGSLSFSAAKVSNGVVGDGSNSLNLSVTSGGDFTIGTNDWWMNLWFKLPTAEDSTEKVIVSLSNTDFQLQRLSNNRLQFFVNHTTGNTSVQLLGPYLGDTWINAHCFYDHGATRIGLRVDDTDQNTKNISGLTLRDRTTTLSICGHASRSTDGIVDNVVIGKGALASASEITAFYNSGAGLSYAAASGIAPGTIALIKRKFMWS